MWLLFTFSALFHLSPVHYKLCSLLKYTTHLICSYLGFSFGFSSTLCFDLISEPWLKDFKWNSVKWIQYWIWNIQIEFCEESTPLLSIFGRILWGIYSIIEYFWKVNRGKNLEDLRRILLGMCPHYWEFIEAVEDSMIFWISKWKCWRWV